MSPSNLPWISALEDAAEQFDGGPRSFPLASESSFAHRLAYDPPNMDYQKLFWQQATVSSSQRDALFCPHSAGWLIPDETSVCKPVFVAHSMLSAIWLLRETLAEDALPVDAWARLVSAAQDLANCASDTSQKEPPSAQRPRDSPPRSTKRAAASSSALLSKRLRLVTESPSPTTPQPSRPSQSDGLEEPEPEEPVREQVSQEEPAQITTITNKNLRAERQRAKKRELIRAQKKQDLGLVPPPESASPREHGAYASISRQDEPFISWILKQPVDDDDNLYSSTAAPYLTASGMLDKARSIGNTTSQASAAAFLRSWRAQGSPFAQEPTEARPPASSRSRWQLSQRSGHSNVPQSALASAWSLCDRYEQELDIIHIKYRWAMAFLGKAYTEKIDQIRTQDAARLNNKGNNRYGKGKVSSEAMDALLLSVTTASGPQQRQRFKRRLHQALRWYEAAKQLGWGMLCLMPHDIISNSWVENDLRIRFWHIWLELVVKVNPVAHKASMALDAWLGSEGISGGSISEKATLSIEANTPTSATQVTEIEDSEMEDCDDGGDEDDVEPAPAQKTAKSPAPICPMRQLTLLELCKPQL
jgi:hypothetical protein